jgi:transposase
VDRYQLIREMYAVEGFSQRAIARTLGISRNTVKKYYKGENMPFEKSSRKRKPTVITPEVEKFVRDCLARDAEEGVPKQQHTAKRIYDRLVNELGFEGGESTIRDLVKKLKNVPEEAFVPLEFDPGEAIQIDWGQAVIYLRGVKTTVRLFCARLCYSAMSFVMAFPHERVEGLIEGHIEAFEFFGGVARRNIYDNMRTIVNDGWGKHVRKEQKDFVQLKAHYAFHSAFCNPGKGNEKGLVEGLVGWSRRNILVPVPHVDSFEELNQLLRQRCLVYQRHTIRGRSKTVGEYFEIERDKLTPLPLRRMEPIRQVIATCNAFSTIRFETNRYSVPVEYVGKDLTVKASVFEVSLWYRGQEIARHPRLYEREGVRYTLEHYLPLLEKKPRAVWNAQPVKAINLPAAFWDFAHKLGSDYEVVKLLKLLSRYGTGALLECIKEASSLGSYCYEVVRTKLEEKQYADAPEKLITNAVEIKQVDLSAYDVMIAGGDAI